MTVSVEELLGAMGLQSLAHVTLPAAAMTGNVLLRRQRMRRLVWVLSTTMILAITGCEKSQQEARVAPVPMDTPQALVEKAVTAMYSGDSKAFLECFSVSQSEYEVLEAILAVGRSFLTFKADFIETYGQEAWTTFQDPAKAPDGADARLSYVTPEDVEHARRWRPEGDEPKFQFPNTTGPSVITRQGDGWIIRFGEMLGNPSEERLSKVVEMMQAMSALISKYTRAIGRDGIEPEDIDFQMGKEMMGKVLGVKLKAPDRFNIDEISKQNN